MLITNGCLYAGSAEPGGGGGTAGGVAVAAASSGGGHAAGGERSSGPAEASHAAQPVAAAARTREATVQNGGGGQRVAAVNNNQNVYRGAERVTNVGQATVGTAFPAGRSPVQSANAWTDPAGTGRAGAGRTYSGYQNAYRQNSNGSRHHPRGYSPYLYQYYGGYYPIYVDVPVGGDYFGGGAGISSDYDGGPSVVPDPGNGVGPVIAPSTIAVSPPDDGQAGNPADAGPNGQPAPDAAQAGNPTPNPSVGPDSLVEAVQAELARRGYFQGKVDSMFRADTEAAVRHFQQDNYLAPTGHLNEPTLHALNLD